jgi:hypothetical protein
LNLRNFDFFPRLFFKKMIDIQCFFRKIIVEKSKPIRMF